MSGSSLDEDVVIALIVGIATLVCVVFAWQRYSNGRSGAAVVWSIFAAVLGFITWFFAAFEMRLF